MTIITRLIRELKIILTLNRILLILLFCFSWRGVMVRRIIYYQVQLIQGKYILISLFYVIHSNGLLLSNQLQLNIFLFVCEFPISIHASDIMWKWWIHYSSLQGLEKLKYLEITSQLFCHTKLKLNISKNNFSIQIVVSHLWKKF